MSEAIQPLSGERAIGLHNDQKRFFHENGYLILEGFFTSVEVERLKRRIDELWSSRSSDCPLTLDLSDARRLYFHEATEAIRTSSYKLNDVHLIDEVVQDFAINSRLSLILADLLSATPLVCNTLLFENGSQQVAHFDTFFMPSITLNKMCASWLAIDPVTETNGPLFYYPRSHLVEPFRFSNGGLSAVDAEMPNAYAHIERIIREYGLEEQRFYPRPGDVLIWHAQLLHGGSPIANPTQTRKSLVTHYWTKLDFPDPNSWVALGDGRFMLSKSHQPVRALSDRIESFVSGLATPSEHLTDLPPGFDPRGYLLRNMDVYCAGMDPYSHYHIHGRREGRVWLSSTRGDDL